MKYVMIKNLGGGEEPILFDDSLGHDTFAQLKPISAGMWGIDANGEAYVYGKSVSLGLESKEDDNYYINRIIKKANR